MTTDAIRATALVGTILSAHGTPSPPSGTTKRARRYRITSLIGPGEKGAWVFRAQDESGAPVAVRCPGIPDDLEHLPYQQALDAFLEQAARLTRASEASSDLEQLLAYGIAEPRGRARLPFCVFEWLEGKSLEKLIVEHTGNSVSITEALAILEPAARGLAAVHALGISHRDVRPRNLWLATVGGRTRIKVTQFVLASRIGRADDAFAPAYGAPEHFKRSYGTVGPHTDVYGLALSLVELVSGRRALEGEDETELYLATSDLARRPTPRARGIQVSDAVEAVFTRALAVDPKRRWQNARELWDALVAAVPELTPAAPSARPRAPAEGEEGNPSPATDEPTKSAAGVPSIWSARDQASLIVAPAEDARLPDTAKVASFAPPAPKPPSDDRRAGLSAWLIVGALAAAIAVVIAMRIGRTPAASVQAAKTSSAEPKAPATAPTQSTRGSAQHSDEPAVAVKVQPFLTDMVRVPAGKFTMGTNKEGRWDGPPHTVTITKAFYIDRTEVTAEMYATCIEAGACTRNRAHPIPKTEENESGESSWGCSTVKDQPRHPVNCVDHVQAERFCAHVQKRLPTEAEWEYAARGPDGREYPWGNAAPTGCTMAQLSGLAGDCRDRKSTGEVGATVDGRSPFGALDMAGNVWEWVADGYAPYTSAEATDPKAALSAPYARGILRGGSWDYSPSSAKTTYRFPLPANIGNVTTGFRCARDAND